MGCFRKARLQLGFSVSAAWDPGPWAPAPEEVQDEIQHVYKRC